MTARHLLGFVAGAVLALALSGCASGEPSTMPDVTGKQLDVAKSDIERAGHSGDIEVVGGGLFGVVDESNWTVCEQDPVAGAEISSPRLVVDRDCGDDSGATSEPTTPAESATPIPSADAIDTTLAEILDRINANDLTAGEVYRFDAELMDRSLWFQGATGHYTVTVMVPGSTFEDNQDFFVLLDDASQATDWVPGSVMTFVVENLELDVGGDTSSGWLKVLSAQPAS